VNQPKIVEIVASKKALDGSFDRINLITNLNLRIISARLELFLVLFFAI